MYKELEKYKTGNKVDAIGVLPNKREVPIKQDEYIAGLGDLIQDFIKHESKPYWKRKYYHEHLTELYLKMLNEIQVPYSL